jgi:hypothetical protein
MKKGLPSDRLQLVDLVQPFASVRCRALKQHG